MSLNLDPSIGISKYELRMWTTAIKNGYPITDDIRKAMVQKAIAGLAHTKDDRAIVRFIDVLCKMDGVNVKREAIEASEAKAAEQHNHLHIHGAVGDPALEHRMEQLGLTVPSRLEQMLQDRLPDPPTNGYHANGSNGHANGHTNNGHNGYHHNGG